LWLATLVLALCAGVVGLGLSGGRAEDAGLSTPPPAGGATTVFGPRDRHILTRPAANLPQRARLDFHVGQAVFERSWVPAPAEARATDGLGPLFNAEACSSCHPRNGRGDGPPAAGGRLARPGLVLQLHPADGEDSGETDRGDPVYGRQIQTAALPGLSPEARVVVVWESRAVALTDGTVVRLRAPRFAPADPAYGPLAPGMVAAPRQAPALIGLGLLDAVPAAAILAAADPLDADGDGISGRPNLVRGPEGGLRIGRFGWKAGAATLDQQIARAFRDDLGLSTPLLPEAAGDCTAAQPDCRAGPHGTGPDEAVEVGPDLFAAIAYAQAHGAVPGPDGPPSEEAARGRALFDDIGCAACHRPALATATHGVPAALAGQAIRPYTDLLLHDMGPGLADGARQGLATGQEWRTPPLWGLGAWRTLAPEAGLLHDGRARTITEAILWHGGEAAAARKTFRALPAADRAALLAFLDRL
jgi:CxxC motif-containing protein (DUF1111 family)